MPRSKLKKAVVLLSGGLDSATVLFHAKAKGYACHGLIIDYQQRHRKEIKAAQNLAKAAKCPAQKIQVEFPWGGSSLTDMKKKVPAKRSLKAMSADIPSTYVPARNTIFLSLALGFAEAIGASDIFIGANALDYSGYPDCRPEYYTAVQKVAKLGTKQGIEGKSIQVKTPLIKKTKAQIIRMGVKLGVPYALTWSCYVGKTKPCGTCDSCLLRAKGFEEAGLIDPAL